MLRQKKLEESFTSKISPIISNFCFYAFYPSSFFNARRKPTSVGEEKTGQEKEEVKKEEEREEKEEEEAEERE